MFDKITQRFRRLAPAVDFWSLRLVEQCQQRISVRQGVLEPIGDQRSLGAHITVQKGGGVGFGATCDLTKSGLLRALNQAQQWAESTRHLNLLRADELHRPQQSGSYASNSRIPWEQWPLTQKVDLLRACDARLDVDRAIVDRRSSLCRRRITQRMVTPDCAIDQRIDLLIPGLIAVANRGAETQKRSFGEDHGVQAGLEYLQELALPDQAQRVAEQALALLQAPNCPTGTLDLLLMPEQMMLQIHESVGHPLELDRILGDERNYAGTSFVSPEMFGEYRYGSELLNITFDPSQARQLASYGFDDEGSPASREYIIKDGVLLCPLGGMTSQLRAGMSGVATARSSDWNRPAIDRMANLNLEPGSATMDDLIGGIENGVLMDTNRSWSIDDSRNKFQFGCEYARLIQDGELKHLLRNPNYRGISATFWRSLRGVGDRNTFKLMGTPNCGKGEPNQAIYVGHASPACVFEKVVVFGGAE